MLVMDGIVLDVWKYAEANIGVVGGKILAIVGAFVWATFHLAKAPSFETMSKICEIVPGSFKIHGDNLICKFLFLVDHEGSAMRQPRNSVRKEFIR